MLDRILVYTIGASIFGLGAFAFLYGAGVIRP